MSMQIQTNDAGTQRFDRSGAGKRPKTLPFHVAKVFSQEELMQSVDQQIQRNQSKKQSIEELIEQTCQNARTGNFRFAGEDKVYGYYDFVAEYKRRAEAYTASPQETAVNPQEMKKVTSGLFDAQEVKDVTTENYKITVDQESRRLTVYDKAGNSLGSYAYKDVRVRRDSETGTEVMISEFGTAWYNAVPLNRELKDALSEALGAEELETENLTGFSVKTHSETGIQYLLKNGEEGRGGTILIRSEADQVAYDRLVEEYALNYPNLVQDSRAANFYASLEIRGLAQHTPNGILTMGYDGMSYHDNSDFKRNWSISFYGNDKGYETIMKWFENNHSRMDDLEKIRSWNPALRQLGRYERIWSKEEELQGYLYQ